MIVLDISIVITALPKIHRSLDFSPVALSWVQNAYLLAFGGLLLLGARAGDLIGRRKDLHPRPRPVHRRLGRRRQRAERGLADHRARGPGRRRRDPRAVHPRAAAD